LREKEERGEDIGGGRGGKEENGKLGKGSRGYF